MTHCTHQRIFYPTGNSISAFNSHIGHEINIDNNPDTTIKYIKDGKDKEALILFKDDEPLSHRKVVAESFYNIGSPTLANAVLQGYNILYKNDYEDVNTIINYLKHSKEESKIVNVLAIISTIFFLTTLIIALITTMNWYMFGFSLIMMCLFTTDDACTIENKTLTKETFKTNIKQII